MTHRNEAGERRYPAGFSGYAQSFPSPGRVVERNSGIEILRGTDPHKAGYSPVERVTLRQEKDFSNALGLSIYPNGEVIVSVCSAFLQEQIMLPDLDTLKRAIALLEGSSAANESSEQ